MRARLLRPALGLALLSAATLAASASAAPKPLVLTDPKGDANGVHDQGTGTFGTGSPGPGSQDGKDFLSLTLAPLPGKTCTGYTAVIELAGPPTANSVYRVLGTTTKNSSLLWLQYDNNPVGGTTSKIRWNDGSGALSADLATPAKVDGSKITLIVTAKDLKAAGEKLAGLQVQAPGLDVRSSTGVVTAPSYDVLENEDKSFKPCG